MRKLLLVFIIGLFTSPLMATTQLLKTVITTGGGDYTALATCLSAQAQNLVTADKYLTINCSGATDDTTGVSMSGYTTDASRYVSVTGNSGGVWDNTKYKLKSTSYVIQVQNTSTLYLNNLQIYEYMTTNQYGAGILRSGGSGVQTLYVINCIIRGGNDGSTHAYGLFGIQDNSYGTEYVINTLIYGFNQSSQTDYGISNAFATLYAYNVTISSCDVGMNGLGTLIKNMCCYNNGTDYTGSFSGSSTNNLSKDNTAPAYNTYYRSKTLSFISTTLGSENFGLSSTDSDAIDKGANLSADANYAFSTDIIGTTRPQGSAWDIGAFEYISSGSGSAPAAGVVTRACRAIGRGIERGMQ